MLAFFQDGKCRRPATFFLEPKNPPAVGSAVVRHRAAARTSSAPPMPNCPRPRHAGRAGPRLRSGRARGGPAARSSPAYAGSALRADVLNRAVAHRAAGSRRLGRQQAADIAVLAADQVGQPRTPRCRTAPRLDTGAAKFVVDDLLEVRRRAEWQRQNPRARHLAPDLRGQLFLGAGNQSCVKFIQGPSAVPKWQFSPSKLLETVT